jgi:ATP-dependent helicase HrpA
MEKSKLAVNLYKNEIIEKIMNNQVVVIEAPTGSGKTTQIPQIIFESGLDKWGVIGVTQPRRIAAFGVSNRIASEMNVELGRLVGYKMRFDDMTTSQTKIKIMTDGILLEELRSDPLLMKYSIMIVDEAHERSLNIDFILGLLKGILAERPDFKVIVSSATINAKLFSEYFNGAPIISVETKPYPVEEKYFKMKNIEDQNEQMELIKSIMIDIEIKGKDGDVLIFLPGEGAIKECCSMLESIDSFNHLKVLPLYSRLSPEEQNLVFEEFPGKRKVVVATNIAETSITIDGVVHVIDTGYAKINYYNPRTFTSYLELKSISKASADQRRGRAGRTAPGVVYRLYSKEDYERKDMYTKEEIYRSDLSEVVLRMADLGIRNYNEFDFISPPTKGAINSAIETLVSIEALDQIYSLTPIGKSMVDYPLAPRFSRIMLESINKHPTVLNNVLVVISYLSAKKPFLYPRGEEIESQTAQKKLLDKGGDFFTWINVFFKYEKAKDKEQFCKNYYLDTRVMNEIVNIHLQLTSMLRQRNVDIGYKFDYNKITLCICTGLKQYICKKETKKRNSYKSLTEVDIRVHPGSFLFYEHPEWLVGGEIVNTGRTYLRSGSVIPESLMKAELIEIYNEISGKNKFENTKDRSSAVASVSTSKNKEPDKITLFDKYFDIVKDHGEHIAVVPYSVLIQLKDKKEELLKLSHGKRVAKLFHKEILVVKDNFDSLLRYFDKIELDNGFNKHYPKGISLCYPDDWVTIYRNIANLMKPTVKKKTNKSSGFLTLTTSGDDVYEFYTENDFFTALETNLETLYKIFESGIPAWTDEEKKIIEDKAAYMNAILEELDL